MEPCRTVQPSKPLQHSNFPFPPWTKVKKRIAETGNLYHDFAGSCTTGVALIPCGRLTFGLACCAMNDCDVHGPV